MNGGGAQKRRSARLSGDANGEDERPAKKSKVNGTATTTVDTKQQDGGDQTKAATKKKRKEYEEQAGDFAFARKTSKRKKDVKEPAQVSPEREATQKKAQPQKALIEESGPPLESTAEPAVSKSQRRKTLRRLPTTPERDGPDVRVRRSKRLSDERQAEPVPQPSPHRISHAKSHANTERSPSPARGRSVTVEKQRKKAVEPAVEEIVKIALPFADTPVQRRNKEMRKTSGDGHRRSSAGMRGKRASSVIDEGRGHEASESPLLASRTREIARDRPGSQSSPTRVAASTPLRAAKEESVQDVLANDDDLAAVPHPEVSAAEFFKHISADLTEPRRMRCLLGWCGARLLPPRPLPPKESTASSSAEFQALQAARIIQEELSLDLMNNGTLSDWFSRDDAAPRPVPLRKKANPRNIANAAKAEELERQLERLKKERAEWDELIQSAASVSLAATAAEEKETAVDSGTVSPIHPDLLDSPQRAIYDRFHAGPGHPPTDPAAVQHRLRHISDDLEFTLDQFAHGVHVLSTTRETADRVADRSLALAAVALQDRHQQRAAAGGSAVEQMDALRGLARVLNTQRK